MKGCSRDALDTYSTGDENQEHCPALVIDYFSSFNGLTIWGLRLSLADKHATIGTELYQSTSLVSMTTCKLFNILSS